MEDFERIISGHICPYCKCETALVSDKVIYGPNSTYGGMYYRCVNNPDHYVGTYSNNIKSLGRLADKELREWKMAGHKAFDPLWKGEVKHFKSQQKAYAWLSKEMGIDILYTHFGMFTIDQCQQAIKLCEEIQSKR